jgi:hypothetical protein
MDQIIRFATLLDNIPLVISLVFKTTGFASAVHKKSFNGSVHTFHCKLKEGATKSLIELFDTNQLVPIVSTSVFVLLVGSACSCMSQSVCKAIFVSAQRADIVSQIFVFQATQVLSM